MQIKTSKEAEVEQYGSISISTHKDIVIALRYPAMDGQLNTENTPELSFSCTVVSVYMFWLVIFLLLVMLLFVVGLHPLWTGQRLRDLIWHFQS